MRNTSGEVQRKLRRRKKKDLRRVYLLRCWREGEVMHSQTPSWRFSVEEILHKRRRKGFDSVREVLAFLQTELANDDGSLEEEASG